MSILDKIKLYFGMGHEDTAVSYRQPEPTLEEKIGNAQSERGFAFDLIEQAQDALRAAATLESDIAEESQRRAINGLRVAQESAARILANGQEAAQKYSVQADCALTNAVDDSDAVLVLSSLMSKEDDVDPC